MVIEAVTFKDCGAEWNRHLLQFPSNNIYQSYEWGEYRRKFGWMPQRTLYLHKNKPVGLIQALTKKGRFAKFNITWAPGGPVVSGNNELLPEILTSFISQFNKSFYYVRIQPPVNYEQCTPQKSGFRKACVRLGTKYTFRKNLACDLIKELSKNWRHNLKRALKRNFVIEKAEPARDIDKIITVYDDMVKTKNLNYNATHNENELREMLINLKNLHIWLCADSSGKICAVKGYVSQGETAYEIISASTGEGRKNYSSYALAMHVIEAAKKEGMLMYDLGGTDPDLNIGVHNFKNGIGGDLINIPPEWETTNIPFYNLIFNIYLRFYRK